MPPERVVLVWLDHCAAEHDAGPDAGKTVKLRGHVARPSVGPLCGNTQPAPGLTARGILTTRRIDAIRSQALSAAGIRVQFTD